MGALAGALLAAGPSLIRAAGAWLGGTSQDVADKAADAVEAATGQPDPASALNKALSGLSPEQIQALGAIRTQIEQIDADREKTRIQAGVDDRAQINKTMRAEVQSNSIYKGGWRSAIGWTMALSFLLMTGSLCYAVINDPAQLPNAVSGMMTLAVAMAAVLGINIGGERRLHESSITKQPSSGLLDILRRK